MKDYPKVRLNTSAPSHPWIYWNATDKLALPPGTVVDVYDKDDHWIGRGFYNAHARIRVRLLTTDQRESIDPSFFDGRIAEAVAFRKEILQLEQTTNAFRLVHSDGDQLGGVVIDRFAHLLVLQFYSAGMYRFRDAIQQSLQKHFPGASFYSFAEEHVQKQESFDLREMAHPEPVEIFEGKLRLQVWVGTKHKTGFFLDQRENRLRFAELCQGKNVLDLCSHTGAFALHACAKNAKQVTAVELDEEAVQLAEQNAGLNGLSVKFLVADVLEWLHSQRTSSQYDRIVLDPPKQTRSEENVRQALNRYFEMNRLAIKTVTEGGILLTCSCSGLIKEDTFIETLHRAAQTSGKTLQIFRISGAAPDHPFLIENPEGRYLKAIWARVFKR
ncbi:MAG: class I SAM-dependent rRNA methyltransferase [Deltaproteobacteria bacterium]|nr:class I SAM-dependent rRNA methyltransferase [Deltaproteobacteria bacterium]